ncbi:MAG: DNA translocase FtsK [bacterium]|nr:DNA translocase FtsK [bacterium]
MGRRKKEEEETLPKEGLIARWFGEESEHAVLAIVLVFLFIFILLSLFGSAGVVGQTVNRIAQNLFGISVYVVLLSLVAVVLSLLKTKTTILKSIGGSLLLYIGLTLLLELPTSATLTGSVGGTLYVQLSLLIGPILTGIAAFTVALVAVAILYDLRLTFIRDAFIRMRERQALRKELRESEEPTYLEEDAVDVVEYEGEEIAVGTEAQQHTETIEDEVASMPATYTPIPYTPPPVTLLEKEFGKPRPGDIKANSNLIKRTLSNFGINVEMDEVSVGPSITRYAMKPAEGVKLSRIVGLQDNLAMALAAHPLRIEAPIPGKSLVGIEIPNAIRTTVGLGPLLNTKEFQNTTKHLAYALGRNVSGQGVYTDLAKAPHILVAGATGSGKSVTIHCMIQSMLYQHGPGTLRFLMIDPKRVELTLYNKIPHLLTPVITDPKKAILALKWAAKEMERRYDLLEAGAVRDIQSYHENILAEAEPEDEVSPMPYIIIVIDELADLMSTYPRELEAAIVRLAQKSRAVGIHLIISTQRPSTDVITGLIKANIPARIALQVPSQIDSRTILDMPGAEKLLGAGDMLYLGGEMSKPIRIQCGFISEKEVKKVVEYIASTSESLPDEIDFAESSATDGIFASASLEDEIDDNLYEEARELVIQAGKASTSYLQRRLKIGYSRAARLIDMLEERGVVGPAEGSKPREIFVSEDDRQIQDDEK